MENIIGNKGSSMVNLELYRIFTIVAKEGNLTRASAILHISQPAVTKHIKNLENELQVNLFKRNKYGMELTDKGQMLYDEIKDSISILSNIDKKINEVRNIKLGSHVTMLSRMFGKCIADYYKENSRSQIDVTNETFNDMLYMLENQKLDIVLSKKVDEKLYNNQKITFISLGYLHDIFVINTNSRFIGKTLSKEELKNEVIYTPKKTSITAINLMKALEIDEKENIKNVTYTTMLGILKNEDSIGIITKEYVQEELKDNKICELSTDLKLAPIEFGVYLNNDNRFRELNSLVKIIKKEFLK